ncbi:MAG: 16S rRNA (cytosine(967)-C(5))-methyltransferase RsmB [Clostridia bacterium]|nr:16S rRNA (cytosine(967)-C(5))-methyltransferase RsmB [Clostridia bacterium]
MKNPREAAFEVLLRVETDGSYSNLTLDKVQKENNLQGRDASFCTALVYGVLERQLTLDYIIRQYSSVRLKKIEPKALIILRMGVYQLLYMDSVHSAAAVNESVNLAKKQKLHKASGFINALLRSFVRAELKYTMPLEDDKVKYLSVKFSCPEDIVKLWLTSYPEALVEDMLSAFMGRPELTLRVNTLKTTRERLKADLNDLGVKVEFSPLSENALRISSTGSVESLAPFAKGEMYIQDISSVICSEQVYPKEGERVADVCSAPGSKSFSMALLANDKAQLHSFDLYPHKVELIKKSAKRLGITSINAEVKDALSDNSSLKESFDVVLCDAPCSGLGVIGRKPEIRNKAIEDINSLPDLQYRILENSSKLLKAGGRLFYSTCTLNPKENNEIADKFLKEHSDFEALGLNLNEKIKKGIEEKENQLTLFPHINSTDGFFISAFRKVR